MMSMLAEPKRRVKWSLNPRGNLWAKDDSKFGQKLLEKMGWRKGKGLGKLENGQVDHVRVVYKNDNNGVGWDEKTQGWISHQNQFDTLLASLNNNYSKESEDCPVEKIAASEPVSLEQRAKSFRNRLHYQKFLHAKDVSQYSQEDIESIFGKKVCADKNLCTEVEQQADVEHDKEDGCGDYSNYNGVTTFKSSSSLADYFSQKMRKFGLKGASANSVEQSSGDVSENGCESATTNAIFTTQDGIEGIVKKKKKKRSKNKQGEKGIDIQEASLSCDVPNITEENVKRKRKHPNEESLVCTEFMDIDSDNIIPKKCKKLEHATQSLHVVTDVFVNDTYENLSEPVLGTELKSCLKTKSASNLLQKKSVTFSECISSCQNIPSVVDDNRNDSDEIKESSSSLSREAEMETSFSTNAALPNSVSSSSSPSIEIKANSLWVQKSFALGQFAKPESMLGRNNESWNVSIKLAEKMEHYASIIKNIQLHEVLSTTNLLDIKGYGN